ncbi:MAG: hypothetical protein M1401_14545 [Chloroflexi bacterium]|nr:hypothetical protein [Chloroflexota bacterium]
MILLFLLLLSNDRCLLGDFRNSRLRNALGWGTLVLVSATIAALLVSLPLSLFGINLLGG